MGRGKGEGGKGVFKHVVSGSNSCSNSSLTLSATVACAGVVGKLILVLMWEMIDQPDSNM